MRRQANENIAMNSTDRIEKLPQQTAERLQSAFVDVGVVLSYDANVLQSEGDGELSADDAEFWKFDWIITVVIFIIMATSLVGNSVVIYVICTRKRSRTAQNISIVSICVAAILAAGFVMPTYFVISTYDASKEDRLCRFLCKLEVYVCYWCKTVTAYSLCALVCDRYALSVKPTKRDMLSGRYVFFLSFVWFFGAAYNIWDTVITLSRLVVVATPDGRNVTLRRCVTSDRFNYIQDGVFYSDVIVIYVIPSVAICYMYAAIVYCHCFRLESANQRLNKRKLLLSIAFLFAFYVCQLPLEVMDAWGFFGGLETFELMIAKRITEVMSFANGFFNVIIYVLFSSDLQVVFRRRYPSGNMTPYRRVLATSGRACAAAPQIQINDTEVRNGEEPAALEMTLIVIEGAV